MHPLCGALTPHFVPVRVIHGALIAHRYSYAPPRRRIRSQYRRTYIYTTLKQTTNNNDLLEKDGGTKNCIYKD